MKRRIKALSIPLLAAVLVLTGCKSPLAPQQPGPEGAYVKVRFETPRSNSARTIYPEFPPLSKYELGFSGPETKEPVTLNSGGPHIIALAAGSWTITATAFTGTEGAYAVIARGSAAVTVTLGETAEAAIALAPVSGEAGTFRYAVTLPPEAAGSLVITTSEGGAVSGGTISLQSGAPVSGVLNLPTGQYLMNISLTLGERRAGRTEALHIYPYRESSAEYRFFEHDFRLVGNLAYNRWEEAELEPGEVHWYKFDADGETSYRVQWNGVPPQGDGAKSLPASVSAYTGDNTFVFEDETAGWVSPEAVSGIAGTVYLRVRGAGGAEGSYALRYYNPAELPPQEGIN
ncbi:MAG: fibronectin type III domain-containing protein, partial [Spirochaetaceae bacterium]|nr:fibronectin type III domain-containing protein [Spirochaetaceae bacterium]